MTRRKIGGIELTVKKDLARLKGLDEGVKPSHVALALNLARIIDSWAELPSLTAAQMSSLVKAHQQLAILMGRLGEAREDDGEGFGARMGSPVAGDADQGAGAAALPPAVWHAAQPEPADFRASGG